MPVTRSASGATAKRVTAVVVSDVVEPKTGKRKAPRANSTAAPAKKPRKTAKSKQEPASEENSPVDPVKPPTVKNVPLPVPTGDDATQLVPAVLTFSFEEAKRHLISVDRRFEDLFQRLKCKPFEHLERLDPFRTLANSILGQQISWLAARSITHRFIRLFDPSLPEKPTDQPHENDFFPTARQVITKDIATLRSAGLSGRKAEYVLDLANRFADGRLSTEKLLEANDEDLYSMLIEVRGIGRWTVDMFALFSLRRPDILPIGDLGVQRGVLRWFLSLHAPSSYPITISPAKLPKNPAEDEGIAPAHDGPDNADEDTLPTLGGSFERPLTPDASSVPPAPLAPLATPVKRRRGKGKGASKVSTVSEDNSTVLPTPFTPSINKTLNMNAGSDVLAQLPPPLPEGLTPAILKSRLDGKKKIKGALLTPKEMEELTESWRPYRSLGVYYMWALAEPPK